MIIDRESEITLLHETGAEISIPCKRIKCLYESIPISAVNTHRNLVVNNGKQAEAMEQLSSGLKVNRGADGPASLVISERLRAQTAGLKQAIDNSEAGISMVQTAEAALNEVSSALIAARQLAVHAANEAVNDEVMLQADQKEISNILATINRVVQSPQFGMKVLLDGSKGQLESLLEQTWNLWSNPSHTEFRNFRLRSGSQSSGPTEWLEPLS